MFTKNKISALKNGTLAWSRYPMQDKSPSPGVSDIVEILHFAGLSKNVEAIFDKYPVINNNYETERWYTSKQHMENNRHHVIQTRAHFL